MYVLLDKNVDLKEYLLVAGMWLDAMPRAKARRLKKDNQRIYQVVLVKETGGR